MTAPTGRVKAVLFDRDGTLVEDVPYNADPDRVRPVDGARQAVALLRAHGVGVGVITNQSGVARGLLCAADVRRVNERVEVLLGPFDVWAVCPHGPGDGCACRKPRPGMVLSAAGRLRVRPEEVVVIGDIGSDMAAARAAGAHGVLVPTPVTRAEEVTAADHVAANLLTAVRAVLTDPPWGRILADERPLGAAYAPGPAPPSGPAQSVGSAPPSGLARPSAPVPDDGTVRTAPRAHRPVRPSVQPSVPDDRRRPG